MRGDIAEVWQGDRQVGLLFRWALSGFDGKWDGAASKHRFESDFDGQEAEIRFQIENMPWELRGTGHVIDAQLDGATHHETVLLKGTRLWVTTGIPELSGSN
jgi:hypothetical protein